MEARRGQARSIVVNYKLRYFRFDVKEEIEKITKPSIHVTFTQITLHIRNSPGRH